MFTYIFTEEAQVGSPNGKCFCIAHGSNIFLPLLCYGDLVEEAILNCCAGLSNNADHSQHVYVASIAM